MSRKEQKISEKSKIAFLEHLAETGGDYAPRYSGLDEEVIYFPEKVSENGMEFCQITDAGLELIGYEINDETNDDENSEENDEINSEENDYQEPTKDEINKFDKVQLVDNNEFYMLEDGIELVGWSRTRKSGGERKCKYPLNVMNVGQSFFVPNEEGVDIFKTLTATVNNYNLKFREIVEGETRIFKGKIIPVYNKTRDYKIRKLPGGVRVWRVM